jgi:hypothetical protein
MHMSDPKSFPCTLALTFALTLAAAGVAPVRASTPDSLPVQLKHCASLSDSSTRLACYDALAGSPALNHVASAATAASSSPPISSPTSSGATNSNAANSNAANSNATNSNASTAAAIAAPGAPPAGAAAPPAQAEFDFGVHNGPLEAKLINTQREKQMLAVVSAISNRPRGELVVTLDNGQVWAQIEATRYPLKPGDHVEIDVGAMGSYVLWCPSNRRATKVTRIS